MSIVLIVSESKTPRAVERASKYFVVQAVARSFLVMGIMRKLLIGGSLEIFRGYRVFPYFLFLVGVFIKLAVLPRPFWFVDVVSGVKLVRGFYVVISSKIVPVYLFVCLSREVLLEEFSVLGVFSVFLGSVLGVNQVRIRKIIAFSSIAHIGWVVRCFPTLPAWSCLLLFLCYVVMLVPLFLVGAICSIEYVFKKKGTQHFSRVALFIVISFLSLGGLPPLVGFFYKWVMFLGLTRRGFFLVARVLVLLSLVSLYFYLNVCFSAFRVYWSVPQSFRALKFMSFGGLYPLVRIFLIQGVICYLLFSGPLLGV